MVVLGAGIVGTAAAWDLRRRGHQVLIADADAAAADEAADALDVTAAHLDAADGRALRTLLHEASCAVSAVPYTYGVAVAQAAIDTGTHVLDFGGNPEVVRSQLELDAAARRAGVMVVPDCGLAPGLANVLAVDVARRLEDCTALHLRVGALPAEPTGSLGYQLAFSPAGLINEYAEPCDVLVRGKEASIEPLTEFEALHWHGTELEAFSTAGGTSRLPSRYAGVIETLDYKTIRYPGHGRVFRALFELGLFEQDEAGEPRATLLRALADRLPHGDPDVVYVRVEGVQPDGSRLVIEIEDRHDGRFSALARTTAFPATALADLIVRGEVDDPGVAVMHDAVAADALLPELTPVGITVTEAG